MAYFSQEMKKERAESIKNIAKKYGVKVSLAVQNHSTLVVTIKSGKLNFIADKIESVGNHSFDAKNVIENIENIAKSRHFAYLPYWNHQGNDSQEQKCLKEIYDAAMKGNHDNSDVMTDYFDVGFYVDVQVGAWNKPYQLEA